MQLLQILFAVLGTFSFCYYIVIIGYAGKQTAFAPFWLGCGIVELGIAISLTLFSIKGMILSQGWCRGIFLFLCFGIILFLGLEAMIFFISKQRPFHHADYVIVLGAQVRGKRVTKSLRYRLDVAISYLKENSNTKVIVSGGKGTGEDISEAEAMERYLLEYGIEKNRIIKEDKSTNTEENIRFSKAFIKTKEEPSIVIATSSFHVFRATQIAKKQGLKKVNGLAAKNDSILVLSYYVRESLAIIKDFLCGNLSIF